MKGYTMSPPWYNTCPSYALILLRFRMCHVKRVSPSICLNSGGSGDLTICVPDHGLISSLRIEPDDSPWSPSFIIGPRMRCWSVQRFTKSQWMISGWFAAFITHEIRWPSASVYHHDAPLRTRCFTTSKRLMKHASINAGPASHPTTSTSDPKSMSMLTMSGFPTCVAMHSAVGCSYKSCRSRILCSLNHFSSCLSLRQPFQRM